MNSSPETVLLSKDDQKELLQIARNSIAARLKKEDYSPQTENPALQVERGLFVSLHNHGNLRGCLGRFDSGGMPLYELVAVMAPESAMRDLRFSSVTIGELPDIDIEISVLSPLEQVSDPSEIQVGVHGLQVRGVNKMGHESAGTLLPQVASERGWDVETFLDSTCVKAGLAPQAWQDPSTVIYKYSAQVFGDLDFSKPPYAESE